ncbi:replication protein A 70 kDa DNA-binding subunit B-like [Chenopodium quinoa]|uniref:replication protein A 70 kDa DNA-binding subunit B-like n=1 Tax=Chenopodium quinoa TaxID=63459 RepID=UPI000B797CDC|nr:replication protein A 70 kDa DNA-binding subunit B-like [Chenopodium quinoa]
MLLDQDTKILRIRTLSRTTAVKTISEIKQKNAGNTMQEERCNNCGKRCQEARDTSFKCLHCSKNKCIATVRVNFTVDVTDATGTLRFTAFAEDCEKLIGLPTSEIYEKKMAGDWTEFEEIATNLKAIHFQIAPTTSLTRIRVLKWALKDISFD